MYPSLLQSIMKNETRRRLQENKPNRTQFVFFTVLRAETIASYRIYCYDFIKAESKTVIPAEVIGAWWCSWSSKPVWGLKGPGWVRFPFASAIFSPNG